MVKIFHFSAYNEWNGKNIVQNQNHLQHKSLEYEFRVWMDGEFIPPKRYAEDFSAGIDDILVF